MSLRFFSIFLACWLFPFSTALAFKITPMSVEVAPTGKEARTSFQIENDSDAPVPIQIVLAKRVVDEKGAEKYPPAGDDFMVFPTQVILAAKEKRAINVRYMAGTKGDHRLEKAYRVIAEQLPLPLEGEKEKASGAGINVLLRYIAALYVVPTERIQKLSVPSAKLLENGMLEVRLKNEGTVHQILDHHALKITFGIGKEQTKTLQGEKELKGLFGENILAGHERVFNLTPKLPKNASALKVEILEAKTKE